MNGPCSATDLGKKHDNIEFKFKDDIIHKDMADAPPLAKEIAGKIQDIIGQ
jgi:hypothetical protein